MRGLFGMLAELACLLLSVHVAARGPTDIRMVVGERVFLRVGEVRTLALSSPSVASASTKGETLLIEAKGPGICYVNVQARGGPVGYRVVVDENPLLSKVAERAQRALPSSEMAVYGTDSQLVLVGRARSEEEAREAERAVMAFWPKVRNELVVWAPRAAPLGPPGRAASGPPTKEASPSFARTAPWATTGEGGKRRISLLLGTGTVITTKGLLERVALADETICQCVIVSAHQVFLIAKKPGTTSLYIWEKPLLPGEEERVWEYEVEVTERKENLAADLEQTLREAGLPNVRPKVVGEKVILLGRVQTEEEKRRAEAIAIAFAGTVVNLVEVEEPPPPPPPKVSPQEEKAREIEKAIGIPGVSVKVVGNSVVLTGEVETEEQKRRAEETANLFGLKVVNQLSVRKPEREKQVQVEARAVELDWRWMKNLGLEWGTTDLFGYTRWFKYYRPGVGVGFPGIPGMGLGVGFPGAAGVGMGLTTGALSLGELWAGGGFARLSPLFILIRFLEEKNIGRVLQAPNLTLKDGETGSINVGGEIPLPSPAVGAMGAVAVGVTYKKYGITLEVTPKVKKPDLIDLTIRAEVSELDWENAVTIMGTRVPGTRTREAQTVLQVRDGETIVIGGLISEEEIKTVHKVPVLGNLPIIGGLFRRREERKGQTVLAFFLTAHILE